MITRRQCHYCRSVYIMRKAASFDPIGIVASEFHGLNWNVRVSEHVAECRAEWLSLVASEPEQFLEKPNGLR